MTAQTPAISPEGQASTLRPPRRERLVSLDAYRGFIMFTLAAAGFGSVQMAQKLPDSIWSAIAGQFTHTPWLGGVFWDMIMPAFLLMVGAAIPLSSARRGTDGNSFGQLLKHALIRSLVLIGLGMILMPQHSRFLNVLTTIGLGYTFVFLLQWRSIRFQTLALLTLLTGYWLLFALYPTPGPDYDFSNLRMTQAEVLPGFWAHWSKHTSIAADFDRWLLNLIPQDKPFFAHVGGVPTLNFIPAMANMTLGLMAGQLLMSERSPSDKLRRLIYGGLLCMALALIAGITICPIVKRIWTPSFALYSGAWTLWMLAFFYWIIDVRGWRAWSFPLVVLGANSLAVYFMTMLWPAWIGKTFRSLFGQHVFAGTYGPVFEKLAVLAVIWAFSLWLYRNKLFFRV